MRFLLVDDSAVVRSMVGRMLTELGVEWVPAEHGRSALEAIESHGPFDVALVDWNMPEMDGIAFVESVRGSATAASMKTLMITTRVDEECVLRALEAGADDYLMKPFDKDALVAKLSLFDIEIGA